ncbi:unnamed protein product [Lepidochelys olivacea]
MGGAKSAAYCDGNSHKDSSNSTQHSQGKQAGASSQVRQQEQHSEHLGGEFFLCAFGSHTASYHVPNIVAASMISPAQGGKSLIQRIVLSTPYGGAGYKYGVTDTVIS